MVVTINIKLRVSSVKSSYDLLFFSVDFVMHLFEVADYLILSIRKLVGRPEIYGSRPSLTIDVCSERQVQLTLEVSLLALRTIFHALIVFPSFNCLELMYRR